MASEGGKEIGSGSKRVSTEPLLNEGIMIRGPSLMSNDRVD